MTVLNIESVSRDKASLPVLADWAAGIDIRLPAPFNTGDIGRMSPADIERLRLTAAFTDRRPASSRLPVSYTTVPPLARQILAKLIGRVQRARTDAWARFPGWPVDLSVDALADIAGVAMPSIRCRTPCSS